jgi:hypothetical protein
MKNPMMILVLSLALTGASTAKAGSFHFPVGLTYASGITDVANAIEDSYERAGFNMSDNWVVPLGLTFDPYYEFDFGLGVGLNLGPTAVVSVWMDNDDYYYDSDDARISYIIPVGAHLRYTFLRSKIVSPYLKVGFRYPIAGGDDIDSSRIGPYGAIGIEVWRTRRIGFSVEFGYDASEVIVRGPDARNQTITFGGYMLSVSALF